MKTKSSFSLLFRNSQGYNYTFPTGEVVNGMKYIARNLGTSDLSANIEHKSIYSASYTLHDKVPMYMACIYMLWDIMHPWPWCDSSFCYIR